MHKRDPIGNRERSAKGKDIDPGNQQESHQTTRKCLPQGLGKRILPRVRENKKKNRGCKLLALLVHKPMPKEANEKIKEPKPKEKTNRRKERFSRPGENNHGRLYGNGDIR